MEPFAMVFLGIGVIFFLVGFIGSIVPILPGPVFTAIGNLILQIGLVIDHDASGVSWFFCILSILFGIVMTVADFLMPGIVSKIGYSGKTAGRYATIGVFLACFFSCTGGGPISIGTAGLGFIPTVIVSLVMLFGFAYLGGRVGELQDLGPDEPNRLQRAHKSGMVQMLGLLISSMGKVVYAIFGCILGVVQVLLS